MMVKVFLTRYLLAVSASLLRLDASYCHFVRGSDLSSAVRGRADVRSALRETRRIYSEPPCLERHQHQEQDFRPRPLRQGVPAQPQLPTCKVGTTLHVPTSASQRLLDRPPPGASNSEKSESHTSTPHPPRAGDGYDTFPITDPDSLLRFFHGYSIQPGLMPVKKLVEENGIQRVHVEWKTHYWVFPVESGHHLPMFWAGTPQRVRPNFVPQGAAARSSSSPSNAKRTQGSREVRLNRETKEVEKASQTIEGTAMEMRSRNAQDKNPKQIKQSTPLTSLTSRESLGDGQCPPTVQSIKPIPKQNLELSTKTEGPLLTTSTTNAPNSAKGSSLKYFPGLPPGIKTSKSDTTILAPTTHSLARTYADVLNSPSQPSQKQFCEFDTGTKKISNDPSTFFPVPPSTKIEVMNSKTLKSPYSRVEKTSTVHRSTPTRQFSQRKHGLANTQAKPDLSMKERSEKQGFYVPRKTKHQEHSRQKTVDAKNELESSDSKKKYFSTQSSFALEDSQPSKDQGHRVNHNTLRDFQNQSPAISQPTSSTDELPLPPVSKGISSASHNSFEATEKILTKEIMNLYESKQKASHDNGHGPQRSSAAPHSKLEAESKKNGLDGVSTGDNAQILPLPEISDHSKMTVLAAKEAFFFSRQEEFHTTVQSQSSELKTSFTTGEKDRKKNFETHGVLSTPAGINNPDVEECQKMNSVETPTQENLQEDKKEASDKEEEKRERVDHQLPGLPNLSLKGINEFQPTEVLKGEAQSKQSKNLKGKGKKHSKSRKKFTKADFPENQNLNEDIFKESHEVVQTNNNIPKLSLNTNSFTSGEGGTEKISEAIKISGSSDRVQYQMKGESGANPSTHREVVNQSDSDQKKTQNESSDNRSHVSSEEGQDPVTQVNSNAPNPSTSVPNISPGEVRDKDDVLLLAERSSSKLVFMVEEFWEKCAHKETKEYSRGHKIKTMQVAIQKVCAGIRCQTPLEVCIQDVYLRFSLGEMGPKIYDGWLAKGIKSDVLSRTLAISELLLVRNIKNKSLPYKGIEDSCSLQQLQKLNNKAPWIVQQCINLLSKSIKPKSDFNKRVNILLKEVCQKS